MVENDIFLRIEKAFNRLKVAFSAADVATWAVKEQVGVQELGIVASLLENVADESNSNRAVALKKLGRIPQRPLMEFSNFDTSGLPGSTVKIVNNLKTLAFVDAHRNIIMTGTEGTGKTHLATAIANACADKGIKPYFMTFCEMKNRFAKAIEAKTARKMLTAFSRYSCLVIDDVGHDTLNERETELFFSLVDLFSKKSYGSLVITARLEANTWAKYFSNVDTLVSTLDRLCDKALSINFKGPSHRGKDKEYFQMDFSNPVITLGN